MRHTKLTRYIFTLLITALLLGIFPLNTTTHAEERPSLIQIEDKEAEIVAEIEPYSVEEDFSNVINFDKFSHYGEFIPGFREKLQENLFAISPHGSTNFHDIYEMSLYMQKPIFVTTDSLLHAYHNYFSFLQKTTETNFLSERLVNLSLAFYEQATTQYEELKGTDWEEAAKINLAYFTIASSLLGQSPKIHADVKELIEAELAGITSAEGIMNSPLFGRDVDYSQYIVRGYYAGDELLENYFRAMMFYGSFNFSASEESQSKAAVLITHTLAENEELLALWEGIYQVTSFFAGVSDDNGYYEYAPLISETYKEKSSLDEIAANQEAWQELAKLIEKLPAPEINSIVLHDYMSEEEEDKDNAGFRFMGQRFSWDAAIFQNLIYQNVMENADGLSRYLPDVLDVPAAYGSDLALKLLEKQGDTEFKNYPENMEKLQNSIAEAGSEAWNTSLSSAWQYALLPLLEENGEGHPSYAQSEMWERKQLETFAGSYTELKHDTVLYAKQAMAQMGGMFEDLDTRGFVETEPRVFRRLSNLASATAAGLESLELLDERAKENLVKFTDLCEKLAVIAEKELRGELPTDQEFELIDSIGGQLEHIYIETMAVTEDPYLPDLKPAALVTDIATDPNGAVLQIATGDPKEIFVIVPVDGTLRIAVGAVYDFYQFTMPLAERMTDGTWHSVLGHPSFDEDGNYIQPDQNEEPMPVPEKPYWTQDYHLEKPNYEEFNGEPTEEESAEENNPQAKNVVPDWVAWKEGTISSQNGKLQASFADKNLVLQQDGQEIWKSPSEFLIQDAHFSDLDHDGVEDLVLLTWKIGRYGDYRPFG